MSIRKMQAKFSLMLARLIIYAYSLGFEISMGEGTITVENCPNCSRKVSLHKKKSNHYIKLAQDIDLFKNGVYLTSTASHKKLGHYWQDMGGAWGGMYQDGNHYSLQYGKRQ